MTSESDETIELPPKKLEPLGKKAKGEHETYCTLVHVTTKQILGQDAETKAFVEKAGIVLDFNVDAKLWAKRVTSTMYLMHPLHLIQRKGGYPAPTHKPQSASLTRSRLLQVNIARSINSDTLSRRDLSGFARTRFP